MCVAHCVNSYFHTGFFTPLYLMNLGLLSVVKLPSTHRVRRHLPIFLQKCSASRTVQKYLDLVGKSYNLSIQAGITMTKQVFQTIFAGRVNRRDSSGLLSKQMALLSCVMVSTSWRQLSCSRRWQLEISSLLSVNYEEKMYAAGKSALWNGRTSFNRCDFDSAFDWPSNPRPKVWFP